MKTISNNILSNSQTITMTDRGEAIIGFDTWEEMQSFIEEHKDMNLEPVCLSRRFGHDSWECGNRAIKAFSPASDYNEGCCYDLYVYGRFESEDDFFLEVVRPYLADTESMDEAEWLIKAGKSMWETISGLKENQLAVYEGFDYKDTIEIESMQYSFDSMEYAIGLVNAD